MALLEDRNLIVNVRRSRGKDIDAACGQLANKNAAGEQAPASDQSSLRTAKKADCGTSTEPIWRMRFLPFFCFSNNFRFRVMSPP